MMLLSSQFSKFEVVQNLYALLDSKKTYVRYISHELRYSDTASLALIPCSRASVRIMFSCCCTPSTPRSPFATLWHRFASSRLHPFYHCLPYPPIYPSTHYRTPMNTACLGLGMLLAQATQRSTHPTHPVQPTPEELERLETLIDINASCTTAVEILNDLLTFEVSVRRETGRRYSTVLYTDAPYVMLRLILFDRWCAVLYRVL